MNSHSSSSSMNPNDVAVRNGSYFGLTPFEETQAEIVVQNVPWDVTTSYGAGTSQGPESILEASYQVDLSSLFYSHPWDMKLLTHPWDEKTFLLSQKLRKEAEKVISHLESGSPQETQQQHDEGLKVVNDQSLILHDQTYRQTISWLKKGLKVVTVGGDHSISYGPIKAYAEMFSGLSVLHFDAHADLRQAYEGFQHSHASIMGHVLGFPGIKKLVQVGLRDVSSEEMILIQESKQIQSYFDEDLSHRMYRGENWHSITQEMISHLGSSVYISFDIDGLDPKLCPNTGTPVPGGLEYRQATYIIREILRSGRKIVGADLVEVAPHPHSEYEGWNGNVGARLLFELTLAVRGQF